MSDTSRYNPISMINHWITALLVLAMLLLGLLAAGSPNDEVEHFIMDVHIGLGFFTALFVFWRVGYRLKKGFPPAIGHTPFERLLSHWVHRLLLLLMVLLVLTGPLYLFTENEKIDVFGWFSVGIPLGSLEVIHEPMESIHVVTGLYLLPALLVLHILGGFKLFFNRRRETPADMS